jgi:hypothetical protein
MIQFNEAAVLLWVQTTVEHCLDILEPPLRLLLSIHLRYAETIVSLCRIPRLRSSHLDLHRCKEDGHHLLSWQASPGFTYVSFDIFCLLFKSFEFYQLLGSQRHVFFCSLWFELCRSVPNQINPQLRIQRTKQGQPVWTSIRLHHVSARVALQILE